MPTLTNLQTYLLDFLAASSGQISTSYQTLILNMGQRTICRDRDLPFGESEQDITITNATRTTAIPDGSGTGLELLSPQLVQYTDPDNSANWIEPLPRTHKFLLQTYGKDATQSTGDPAFYSIRSRNFNWFPTPKRTITAHVTYYGLLKDLSAGADHNELTDTQWQLLLYKACAIACAFLMDFTEQLPLWEEAYKQERARVLVDYEQRTFGASEPSSFIEAG